MEGPIAPPPVGGGPSPTQEDAHTALQGVGAAALPRTGSPALRAVAPELAELGALAEPRQPNVCVRHQTWPHLEDAPPPPPPTAHRLGDEEVMDTGAVGMLPYPIAALPVGGRPGTAVDAVLGAPLLSLLLAQLAPELARASFLLSFISQADCSPTNDEPEDRPGQYSAARTSAPPVPLAPAHSQLPHDAVARQPPLQPPAIAPRPRHGSSAASREQLVTASRGTTAFFPALPLGKELRLSPARHRLRRAPGRGCSAPNAGQCP